MQTFFATPAAVCCQYRGQVGSDANLRAYFYVTLFAGATKAFVRIAVENGWWDLTNSTKTYVPTVTIGGNTVYTNGGSNLSHYGPTRWTVTGWLGGDPGIVPRHDAYMMSTGMVPNYWKRIPTASKLNALFQTYTPMAQGGYSTDMAATGFAPHIGLLNNWDALYFTSGDARAYASVLANAQALNSYGIVRRDSDTNLPVQPSLRAPVGSNNMPTTGGGLNWEYSHHPSGGYAAYLLTGDLYYLETMQFQCASCWYCGGRQTPTAYHYEIQTRGVAWAVRTTAQLAAVDSGTVSDEYRALLVTHNQWLESRRVMSGQNLLGILYEYNLTAAYQIGNNGRIGMWQHDFMVATYGLASDMKPFANASDLTAHNVLRDHLYRIPVWRLGTAGADKYCFTRAARVDGHILAPLDSEITETTQITDNAETVFTYTHGISNPATVCDTNDLQGISASEPAEAPEGGWGYLLPAISYAVEDGYTDATYGTAQAALDRLTGADNWSAIENSTVGGGFNDTPLWGIVPRGTMGSVLQQAAAGLSAGQWVQLSSTGISNDFLQNGENGLLGYGDSAIWDPTAKQMHVIGGSHSSESPNQEHLVYSEATHSWTTRAAQAWFGATQSNVQHPYDMTAVDQSSRILYRGQKGDGDRFHQYNLATQVWSSMAADTGLSFTSIAGSLVWFPEMGRLLWIGRSSIHKWNPGTNTWATITSSLSSLGEYHNWGVYNPVDAKVYFGGGVGGDRKLHSISAAETITVLADAPVDMGPPYSNTEVCPVSGDLILVRRITGAGVWRYSRINNSWSAPAAPSWVTNTNDLHAMQCVVAAYGVQLYLVHALGSTPQMWIFKPD